MSRKTPFMKREELLSIILLEEQKIMKLDVLILRAREFLVNQLLKRFDSLLRNQFKNITPNTVSSFYK